MQGMIGRLLALGLMGALAGTASGAELDDATWIARYVAANRAPSTAVSARGQDLAFGALSGHVGANVRVVLNDGRLRRGRVVRADGRSLRLRVELPSGYAHLDLPAARVRSLSLE